MSPSRELRVFISSTFRDLHEERDVLVRKVFPEIRALCRQRGVVFTDVDLRWGLTDEDIALGQIVRTCLEEIDRCRPYFIGITGDTYGYVPTVQEIYTDPLLLMEFPWVDQAAEEGASILDIEFRHGALNHPGEVKNSVAFFFRRCEHDSDNNDEYEHLKQLQERVYAAGFQPLMFRDAGTLAELVREFLLRIIERDFPTVSLLTPLEQQRHLQEAFAQSRRQAYIPNPGYLAKLDEHVCSDGPPLMVYGESGSGKSALLAYWAERLRHRHPELFIVEYYSGIGVGRASPWDIVHYVALEIKERYGVERELHITPERLAQQLSLWLAEVQTEKLVLILDGLNQQDSHHHALLWLPSYIPPQVRLVVSSTSEQTLLEVQHRKWNYLQMQPLTIAERRAIIVRFLAEYRKALSRDQIEYLAHDPKCAHVLFLRTLLEELRLFGIHEELNEKLEEYLRSTDTTDLFQRVLERMEDDFGPQALRQFMALIWAARDGLDEREIADLARLSRLKIATMRASLEFHLIERERLLSFFHDYLRGAVEKRYLQDSTTKAQFHRKIAEYFARQSISERVCRELPWQWEQTGNVEQLLNVISDPALLVELEKQGSLYDLLGYWVRSGYRETMSRRYQEQLTTYITTHSREEIAAALTALCAFCQTAEEYQLGEEVGRQAITIYEQLLGTQHLKTVETSIQLAHILTALGKFTEAEALYSHALSIAEHSDHFPTHKKVLWWNGLATCYAESERYEDAERILRKILETYSDYLQETSEELAMVMHNLGAVVECMGRYAEAEKLYEYVLHVREKVKGKKHPSTITTMINVANIKLEQDQFEEALQLYESAAEAVQHSLGTTTYSLAVINNNMGRIHRILGNYAIAKQLYQEALAIVERVLGPEHPAAMMVMNNLANIYYDIGDYADAEKLHRTVLTLRRRLHGNAHPAVLQSLVNLAYVYLAQGRIDQAIVLREQITEVLSSRIALNSDSKTDISCLDAYIAIQDRNSDHARALLTHLSAVSTKKAIAHTVLEICGDLSLVCADSCAAMRYYQQALKNIRALNPHHPIVARIEEKCNKLIACTREQ